MSVEIWVPGWTSRTSRARSTASRAWGLMFTWPRCSANAVTISSKKMAPVPRPNWARMAL